MFNHRLREVRDLCNYRVTGAGTAPATIGGLIVDATDWRVDTFIVMPDAPRSDPIAVPRSCFRSLDDDSRTLTFEITDEVLATSSVHSGRELQGTPRFDAVSLPGHTLYGRDEPAGTIADLLINVELWQLRYFIVEADTAVVLTDIEWASSLARGSDKVEVDLPAIAISTAPPYESIRNLCSGDEEALYRHYTRSEYVSLDRTAGK